MASQDPPIARLAVVLVCLACFGGWACDSQPDRSQTAQAELRAQAIRGLIDAGRYAEAQASAAAWHRSIQEPSATPTTRGDRAIVLDVLVEARWRNGDASSDALAQGQEALTLRRSLSDAQATARSQRNLGRMLLRAWRPVDAIAVLESAADALERYPSRDDRLLVGVLDDYGLALVETARYEDAERVLRRSLEITEHGGMRDQLAMARTLVSISLVHLRAGRYDLARPPLDRALAVWRTVPEHPDAAMAFAELGDLLWLEGRPAAARDAYAKCLVITQRFLRPNHPDLADCTRRMGNTLARMGDLAGAVPLLEQAIRLAGESLGGDHPFFSGYLNDLAEVHRTMMNFRQARVLYEQGLAIRERRLGPDHQDLATIVFNLGLVSSELGDLLEARRQFGRAIEIWNRRLGADHPFVALATRSLAQVLLLHRRDAEALALQRRVLAMRERSLGVSHHDTADALGDLAITLLAMGQVGEAAPLSERAIAIWDRPDESDSLGLASALTLRAEVLTATGDLTGSRQQYERALALTERVLTADHPDAADLRLRLAGIAFRAGQDAAAFDQALAADQAARRFLESTIQYLPEREALDYGVKRPSGLALVVSLATRDQFDKRRVRAALDTVVRGRLLVLDMIAGRQTARLAGGAQDLISLHHSWVAARQRLANLAVRGADGQPPAVYATLMENARREAEGLERTLAEKSTAFRTERNQPDVGVDKVQAALPAGSVLVSFVQYPRILESNNGRSALPPSPIQSFAAFVVPANGADVALVPLGAVADIEPLIREWRDEGAGGSLLASFIEGRSEAAYRTAGSRLRSAIWDPLAGHLRGARRVFVVPDGALGLVSLAALPIGDSAYLLEQGPTIHYLSAERDLVGPPRATTTSVRGMLALGGPAFDAIPDTKTAAVVSAAASVEKTASLRAAIQACGSFQGLSFQPLDGTLREVQELSRLWSGAATASGEAARVLVGHEADEATFKEEAHRYRVLHLATHGFFLGSGCSVGSSSPRGVGRLSASGVVDNPLLLSGLALAGANRRASAGPGVDDGILTAEEVASLNLDGVEWAVLSACDTGVGEIRAGEGVFGLRRAFQVAGARTVVMSLWSVDDQATRAWMRALYEGRFQKKLSTVDAVHAASLTVLRDRRAKGQSTHPFYWAAFVAAGDWR